MTRIFFNHLQLFFYILFFPHSEHTHNIHALLHQIRRKQAAFDTIYVAGVSKFQISQQNIYGNIWIYLYHWFACICRLVLNLGILYKKEQRKNRVFQTAKFQNDAANRFDGPYVKDRVTFSVLYYCLVL